MAHKLAWEFSCSTAGDIAKFLLIFLLVNGAIGLSLTYNDAARLTRKNVKRSSSASAHVIPRSQHGQSANVRTGKVLHPLSTLKRRRVALVTKAGATAVDGTTHRTSIAPPVQGGDTLMTTRVRSSSPSTTSTATTTSTSACPCNHVGAHAQCESTPCVGNCCNPGFACINDPGGCPAANPDCCLTYD